MFEKELSEIQDPTMKKLTELLINNFPRKFWSSAASSTGKYHPRSSQGSGGLVRHTIQVFWIAKKIIDSRMFELQDIEKDTILAACILHDGWKYNEKSYHTLRYHGIEAVEKIADIVTLSSFFKGKVPHWYMPLLECVQAHNGYFTKEWQGEFSLQQKIVHIADFLASQKFLVYEEN